MTCKECGAELENNSGICPSCGAPVDADGFDPIDMLDEEEGEPEADFGDDPDETSVLGNPDATAVYGRGPRDPRETVVVPGAFADPGETSVLGNPDATAVYGEPDSDDVPDLDFEDGEEEPAEYVRYEGYATFMPIDEVDDSGIDVDPDELTGLEPIAMRDLGEDEIATTAIGPAYQMDGEAPKSHRGLKIFLAIFITLLVIAGAVCGVAYFKYKDKIAHEDVAVHVVMDVPGYPAGDGSSTIPVRVAGIDLDGNSVDERMYFEEAKGDIELKRGEYQIAAVGTPVTGEGAIYRYPKSSVGVVIDETGVHAAGAGSGDADDEATDDKSAEADEKSAKNEDSANSDAVFMGEKVHLSYEQIAPERISDTMIEEAVAWMADSEADAPKAETLKAAITKARDARLKQMEEEKKALEKQRREEELKSALEANPDEVDSTSREWSFTGTIVEYEFGYEIDGVDHYYHQYAIELPEETSFDIVSKGDEKKLDEQKKAAEEEDEADDDDEEADEEEDEKYVPSYVTPTKSTKIIILSTSDSASSDSGASGNWADLVGKTVTVRGKLKQSITDEPKNDYSQIHFVEATAVKVFEEIKDE